MPDHVKIESHSQLVPHRGRRQGTSGTLQNVRQGHSTRSQVNQAGDRGVVRLSVPRSPVPTTPSDQRRRVLHARCAWSHPFVTGCAAGAWAHPQSFARLYRDGTPLGRREAANNRGPRSRPTTSPRELGVPPLRVGSQVPHDGDGA